MSENLTNDNSLVNWIIDKTNELGLSASDISKGTSLSERGISKILNKESKNPRRKNLLEIQSFIESKQVGSAIPGHPNYIQGREREVAEPGTPYTPAGNKMYGQQYVDRLMDIINDKKKIIALQEEKMKITGELKEIIDELRDKVDELHK